MSTTTTNSQCQDVRLNDVDWKILEVMKDEKRYTQTYLDKDVDELDDVSYDWLRQRISHLHDNGLIEKVGSSSMYVITKYGHAALELQDEIHGSDLSPVEIGEMVRERAQTQY